VKGLWVEYWFVNVLARMKVVNLRMYHSCAKEISGFANGNKPFEWIEV
jgi:hypothetical protein